MNFVAIKMHISDRVKHIGILIGITFASLLITQQSAIFVGVMCRTLGTIVDVDENDAWRVKPGATAVAFARGNRDIKTPIQCFRVEPYVVPRKSLTGDNAERVDTRVLPLIYSFQRGDMPVYIGQQMDVFIEAPPIGSTSQVSSAPTREVPTTRSRS